MTALGTSFDPILLDWLPDPLGRPQQHGPADLRVPVDGREQTAESDEVVHVVNVVRIPVVPTLERRKAYLTPIYLYFSRTQPGSWSTLLADTRGQLVEYTSFQFSGSVSDLFALAMVLSFLARPPGNRRPDRRSLGLRAPR